MNNPSSSTRLEQLFYLYKSGKLRQEEFDLLKTQILSAAGSQAKAEEEIDTRTMALESVNEINILKLIHEIEVYEIELHLQNLEANRAAERIANGDRYAQLYDFAPIGYFSLTQKGVIEEFNLRGTQMLGKDRSFIIKKQFDYFIDDSAKSDFNNFLKKAFISKDIETCEVCVSTSGKPSKFFNLSGIIDENEEHCFVTMADITQAKLARQELEKNRMQFKMLMNFLPASVFIKDHESRAIFVNTFMGVALGASKWIGKTPSEVFNIQEASRILHDDQLTLIEGHRIVEESFINLDGETHHYETQKFIIPQSGPAPLIGGISMDISERKKSELLLKGQTREIEAKNDELKKLNAEKDKFFSIIAHDLRSPFNTLLGFTNLLAEDLSTLTLEEIKPMVGSMRTSAEKLYTLLQNLLEWSMMQRGLHSFNPKSVLLTNLLVPILTSVRDSADKKMIGISNDFPENLRLIADEQMFASLMRNLINNAIKFTPTGGGIKISAKSMSDNFVEISIRDSGIGMNQTMLDNLFSLETKINREGTEGEPSTGLGLILCKDYAEQHGGKIYVESEVGKGSTIRFTIPCANPVKSPQ